MYKILNVTDDMLEKHWETLRKRALELMQGFRDGTMTFEGKVGTKHIEKFIYKVCPNSPTWKFLDKYSDMENLKALLCGSWKDIVAIINDIKIWNEGKNWKSSLTKKSFLAGDYFYSGKDEDGFILVDNFHDILYHIFVEELYENSLDKLQFIKGLNLKVCPYCGRNKINVASYEHRRDSKPPIDHFLPKSKYPFLAVSFGNLIPCCTTCNDMANKGDFDPAGNDVMLLENPYEFEDRHVCFEGVFPDMVSMNEEDYDVNMQFSPSCLSVGYREYLKLEEFYKDEKQKMIDMHENLVTFSEGRKKDLSALGIEDEYLNDLQRQVIGFRLDGKASVREFYKFKKEMFEQLLNKYKID